MVDALVMTIVADAAVQALLASSYGAWRRSEAASKSRN